MEIRPFQGWRFGRGEVSQVIAPPYDILSAADKAALQKQDAHNIVTVDLPHVPPSEVGADSEYQASATTLQAWMADGTLRRDERPSFYAYEQVYSWAGRSFRRRTLIAGVRVTEFGKGVWPHEKTFAGPKADRLKLTQTTRVQLSPIFGFYEDRAGLGGLLDGVCKRQPSQQGGLRGVQERLWVIDEPAEVAAAVAAMKDQDIFIADGHHRYTTALNYRATLGELPNDHPANYVMFVLAAMDDPGLIILPTHRLISGMAGFDMAKFLAGAGETMNLAKAAITAEQAADADGFLKPFGPHAMAFLCGHQAYVATPKNLSAMDAAAPEELPVWRRLDVSILHKLVIERGLAPFKGEATRIDYTPDGRTALAAAVSGKAQLAVLLQGTPLADVKEIALAGAVMPHKSTYFYPKPATGMVISPLA